MALSSEGTKYFSGEVQPQLVVLLFTLWQLHSKGEGEPNA